jgi:hypothetical protein
LRSSGLQYSALEHALNSSETVPTNASARGGVLPLGLLLPDAHMQALASTAAAAA